jgi:two-component system invasion response regulator UvrY
MDVTDPRPATTGDSDGGRAEVTVLIVDDQEPFRSAARTVVGFLAGWRVVAEAETGEQGVELASARQPQLVLMDINLPGIDGVEATRRIVAADPARKVVLLSTYAAADLAGDALECGAIAYVRKEDLTPRVLREVLARG